MKIDNIKVKNSGYVECNSSFYRSCDVSPCDTEYTFGRGINKLIGEIDSGIWAVSYLMSMYKHRPKDFVLFEEPNITVNNEIMSLNDFSELSCYMDKYYPLFSTQDSVRTLITLGLKKSKAEYTVQEIKELFDLDDQRFDRPLSQVGNEIFRAMAAIGMSYGKEVYCFPWLSNMRFEYYNNNLSVLIRLLEDLGKMVILPVGVHLKK